VHRGRPPQGFQRGLQAFFPKNPPARIFFCVPERTDPFDVVGNDTPDANANEPALCRNVLGLVDATDLRRRPANGALTFLSAHSLRTVCGLDSFSKITSQAMYQL
jgi:hypothetical protein